ncbi:MAG: GIY-YIG nuclease family protein [Candidatus Moranbacteria bacterium]|nr:GIY-YIG nuclease family protein [Candidatus Moranbacteria bacterium]
MNYKNYFIYILASRKNGVLYTGVTSDLKNRVWQHKNKVVGSFTSKYFVGRLVYYEQTENILSAIEREKVLKKWKRQWKIDLFKKENPEWKDLYETL